MKTFPDLPFEGHIERLIKQLERRIPEVKKYEFLYYDSLQVEFTPHGRIIKRTSLMGKQKLESLISRLCEEGHEWINLAGHGRLGHQFLVSVEYSQITGYPMTAINVAGPSLGRDGRILERAQIQIVD